MGFSALACPDRSGLTAWMGKAQQGGLHFFDQNLRAIQHGPRLFGQAHGVAQYSHRASAGGPVRRHQHTGMAQARQVLAGLGQHSVGVRKGVALAVDMAGQRRGLNAQQAIKFTIQQQA